MTDLDELVSQAAVRRLEGLELDELARLARDSGRVTDVVGSLMQSGPTAAVNLRMAVGLRAAHAERTSSLPVPVSRWSRRHDTASATSAAVTHSSGASMSFSTHAVEQYAARVRPDLSFDEAAEAMAAEAPSAKMMRARTKTGEEQWACPSGAIFVVRRDGPGRPAACVTVLSQTMNIRR